MLIKKHIKSAYNSGFCTYTMTTVIMCSKLLLIRLFVILHAYSIKFNAANAKIAI